MMRIFLLLTFFMAGGLVDTFSRQTLLLGTIGRNDARGCEYQGTPKYSGFKLTAFRGDELKISVSSKGGDAQAWLLDENFKVVVANDDANEKTKDSLITFTVPRYSPPASRYYIVFAEYEFKKSNFSVDIKTNSIFAA